MTAGMVTILAALVGVVGAILGSVVSAYLRRHVDEADIADKMSKASSMSFDRLDKDIERLEEKCDKCQDTLDLVRKDFGAFIDRVETWLPILPDEAQREGRLIITAARQSHLSHNR